MISNKKHIRPANAAGPNGLRGGRNIYSHKTAVGPWLESVGGPCGFDRGFTTEDFITEAQHQQMGAFKDKNTKHFGAALPRGVDDAIPSAADTLSARTGFKNDWMTSTMVMTTYDGKKIDKEFNIPQANMTKAAADEYRKRWTTEESAAARESRYTSETRRALNKSVGRSFETPSVRYLPGTPRPVETFRERLIKHYGIISFAVLRHYCGPSEMLSFRNIKAVFDSLDFKTPYVEVNQIVAYFTAEDLVNVNQFVRTVVALVSGFNSSQAERFYDSVFGNPSAISISEFHGALNAESSFGEVVDGLKTFTERGYCKERSGYLNKSEFLLIFADMWAAAPEMYDTVIAELWR